MKYYEFNADLTMSTEKAYAVGTGKYTTKNAFDANGRDRGFQYEIVKYIPKSQCIEFNGRTFVKGWLVGKNNLWNLVSTESYTEDQIMSINKVNRLNIGDIITINAMDVSEYKEYEMQCVSSEGLNITLEIKGYK